MRIFKDEGKLSLDYVPPALPHREKELHLLNTFFSGLLDSKTGLSNRVVISGAVGTGKSALSKLFGGNIERDAAKKGLKIRYIHINCRINRTLFTVLKRIVEQLRIPLPQRGYSNEELIHGLSSYLDERGLYLILALDEIESLIREESSEPFYYLTRIGEDRESSFSRMSLICILRNPEALSFLDRSTQSTLQRNVIHLEEYTYPQLHEIVKYRAGEAFEKDVVLDDTARLIADIASERGDARYAVELLWRSGKYAEAEDFAKVTPEHVRKASASIYPSIKKENLAYLSMHEKLVLLAAARTLETNEKAYITSRELNTAYKVVCEEYRIPPRAYTRFWEYLQKMEDLGIIRIKIQSAGPKGRRSYITLPEIPASILKHEVVRLLERERDEY